MRDLQERVPGKGGGGGMSTITLTINGTAVEVQKGATILDAAAKAGVEIPTLCFLKDFEASTSCMVCVVEIKGSSRLVPACGYPAEQGMSVKSDTQRVISARKNALELLLSDHLGDCMGPCQVICPANMDIPLMIRLIQAGRLDEAAKVVKKDIALPAALGRICPAPCENGCRRSSRDQAVSICLLKRYVADVDLAGSRPYIPDCAENIGKRVAIIGAGPAGLSAAYYLKQRGAACTVFDKNPAAGGMLRYGLDRSRLGADVLDKELATILDLGIEFQANTFIGVDVSIDQLRKEYDAVFIAAGSQEGNEGLLGGFEMKNGKLSVKSGTYETSAKGVFAGGDVVRKRKLAVRSVADGKEAAEAILQYITGREVTGPDKPFNSKMGRLSDEEIEKMTQLADSKARVEPAGGEFGAEEAKKEAGRCLHCDCRKPDACKLRQYSRQYHASTSQYRGQRRVYDVKFHHPDIIYEQGKCISCGLCIQTAGRHKEKYGLTFIGRGFNVKVAAPFEKQMGEALQKCGRECVQNCPTGALSLKSK